METRASPFHPALWSSLFSAETSASAALTGLLFVSVSINLRQIAESAQLAARAGKAIITLGAVLLISSVCLIPDQGLRTLGEEICVVALPLWALTLRLQQKAVSDNRFITPPVRRFHIALTHASALPFTAGAISLMLGRGGGLYWMVAGTLFSFVSALLDAWVLLIEIQR